VDSEVAELADDPYCPLPPRRSRTLAFSAEDTDLFSYDEALSTRSKPPRAPTI
jgi:hypothetical protein